MTTPLKQTWRQWEYDWINGQLNPHEHPRWVVPLRRKAVAQRYFAWELLHGIDAMTLKKDPYWKYMEE